MFKHSKSKHLNLIKAYESAERLIESVPFIERKIKLARSIKNLKYFSYGILALIVLVAVFLGFQFFVFGVIYKNAMAGKNNLENAIVYAKSEDFNQALIFSQIAQDDFDSAINSAEEAKSGLLISHWPFLKTQFDDIEYLANTAKILSRASEQGVVFAQEIKNLLEGDKKISFSKFSSEEKKKVLGKLYESAPELSGIKANLDLALLNLEKVRFNGILWPLHGEMTVFADKIEYARGILDKAIPMSHILPALAGYPAKSSYLVLLQNNDELRPTGGFLGTYGILETENGDISRLDTHDIYHMDMPVKDKITIEPPAPIKNYLVNKWFMRDANWSPDWPVSARKIEEFYKAEDQLLSGKDKINNFQGEFDGAIAVTPQFITSLLDLTGPIEIAGEKYDKDNFTKLLEYKVERDYVKLGIPSWQRKEVIGDIARELKIKLMDMPSSRWKEIIDVISDNIINKNIFVFINDVEIEDLVKEQGWGGELKDTDGDYFMAVDANLGSFKTDAVMTKSISYKVEQDRDGLIAKVSMNYAHNGKSDWRTTGYNTYTRIYVPLGSKLIKADGFSKGEVDVKNELGKTSFGAFISINPGQIGSLHFEYRLPDYVAERLTEGVYNLYLQKQGGNNVSSLAVDLGFANSIRSYSPTGFYVKRDNANEINWDTDLLMDRKFEVSLK